LSEIRNDKENLSHYWDKKDCDEIKYCLDEWDTVFWLYFPYYLPCHHKTTYKHFVKEFKNWIKEAPLKNISPKDLIADFENGINKEYL
jgi:hypothetical protein